MTSKTTLALIEDLVQYRDRVSDRANRDMLADVANELSQINALKSEMRDALIELAGFYEAICQNLGGLEISKSDIDHDLKRARAVIARGQP
jgi:hypothetical protein